MTDLNTAEVTWDAHAIAQDSSDPDSLPEQIPLQGIRVTLTPSPRKVEVAQGDIEGWPARTVILRDWVLNTGADGILRNPEDPSNPVPVLIVASDAIPGKTIEWTSRISAPDTGVPDIIKTWLAPAGTVVDLTTVDSVPGTGGSNLAQYLQAVADARAAAQNAVDAAESAETSAHQAQVAREGVEAYALSAGDSSGEAAFSATNAEGFASDAQGYRDQAEGFRDSAQGILTANEALGIQVSTSAGTRVTIGGVLVHYSTGIRDIRNLLAANWDVEVAELWRIGTVCYLRLVNVSRAGTAGGILFNLPVGFRVDRNVRQVIYIQETFNTIIMGTGNGVWVSSGLNVVADSNSLILSWPTHNPPPTTLPGTPV